MSLKAIVYDHEVVDIICCECDSIIDTLMIGAASKITHLCGGNKTALKYDGDSLICLRCGDIVEHHIRDDFVVSHTCVRPG
jgi:ribosomal protein L40E